jgi:hypothetical protein
MDEQEQRDIALAKLQQFRTAAAGEKDPLADEVARALEEQRRSKARNRLIGAGKVSSPTCIESHVATLMLLRA